MKAQVIIPAAGLGERLKHSQPKALVPLNGMPLLMYSLRVFDICESIHSMVVVINQDYEEDFGAAIQSAGLQKSCRMVAGGSTRSLSVRNGLNALDKDTEVVLIHDGARPLLSPRIVEDVVRATADEQAVVVGVPLKPTIKEVDAAQYVSRTLDRGALWEIQTPQAFRTYVLADAHRHAPDDAATDDAFLVERLGIKVKVLPGDYENIKVTTRDDLVIASALLGHLSKDEE